MKDVTGLELQERDRIRLVKMEYDPCPIEPGTTGTVTFINIINDKVVQVQVEWDGDRYLMLVPGDEFEIIGAVPG